MALKRIIITLDFALRLAAAIVGLGSVTIQSGAEAAEPPAGLKLLDSDRLPDPKTLEFLVELKQATETPGGIHIYMRGAMRDFIRGQMSEQDMGSLVAAAKLHARELIEEAATGKNAEGDRVDTALAAVKLLYLDRYFNRGGIRFWAIQNPNSGEFDVDDKILIKIFKSHGWSAKVVPGLIPEVLGNHAGKGACFRAALEAAAKTLADVDNEQKAARIAGKDYMGGSYPKSPDEWAKPFGARVEDLIKAMPKSPEDPKLKRDGTTKPVAVTLPPGKRAGLQ